jgi:F-type H+-transporting ATPase subunit b
MLITPLLAEGGDLVAFDYASAFWILGIFLVLVIILYKTAWKHVLAGLKAREERIRGDIAAAEAARAKAEASLKEFNAQLASAEEKAKNLLAQAALDAEKIAAGIRLRSQQEVEEHKERANAEIEASKRQALSEIYDQAVNLSTSIAEKIVRRNLNPDDQRDLVKQSLDQLQSLNA